MSAPSLRQSIAIKLSIPGIRSESCKQFGVACGVAVGVFETDGDAAFGVACGVGIVDRVGDADGEASPWVG
jgi:hypothetical protein